MAKTAKLPIDGKKLEAILKANELCKNDVSQAIGYSRMYLTDCICNNLMPIVTIKALEGLYHIPYELYAPAKKEETKKAASSEEVDLKDKLVKDLTAGEFAKIVYDAVFAAIVCSPLVDVTDQNSEIESPQKKAPRKAPYKAKKPSVEVK